MTVDELRWALLDLDGEMTVGIGLPDRHLFTSVARVQPDAFPDTPTVLLWAEVPEDTVARDLETARAVARAILHMAQNVTGRQFVSELVLEKHPWLKE